MSISNKSCELDMEGDNKMLASSSGIIPAENYQPILLFDFPSVIRILISKYMPNSYLGYHPFHEYVYPQ